MNIVSSIHSLIIRKQRISSLSPRHLFEYFIEFSSSYESLEIQLFHAVFLSISLDEKSEQSVGFLFLPVSEECSEQISIVCAVLLSAVERRTSVKSI